MNIAIIGCGYVGYAVGQFWQQKTNFFITATTTSPERVPTLKTIAQKVVVTQGNDPEGLKAVLENQDIVLLSVGAKGVNLYEATYLKTAENLVNLLPDFPTIKQIIYTGSYSVYGDHNGGWVDEQTPVTPTHETGKILQATENIILQAASSDQVRVCILRLGGIYGPDRELMKIFSRVPGTTRPGDGGDVTNWVHLDDIVGAIELARQQQLVGIYNLVNDAYLTSRELLDRLLEKHGLPKVEWDATAKSNRPYNARVSNRKIKDAGYKFIHPDFIF